MKSITKNKREKRPVFLPRKRESKIGKINKIIVDSNLILGTTNGLLKPTNEDALSYLLNENIRRICISDGHWGDEAAKIITHHWIDKKNKFPSTQKEALEETIKIEDKLFNLFGKPRMDSIKDRTPEASFIAVEIKNNTLSVVSYGDSRLLVVNKGVIKFRQKTESTWLGAFSRLGLRGRLSVNKALKFHEITLSKGDILYLFTDGIDQCIYEKNTISLKDISQHSIKGSISNIFDDLMNKVFTHGAEDNASLVILKI